MKQQSKKENGILKKYSFAWVTLGFFIFSLILHWVFGWFAYVDEQNEFHHSVEVHDYLNEMLRDTFENWQSEFLQLIWQVMGLALLLHVGSPQSKEGDDRVEAKIDAILEKIDPENGPAMIVKIDDQYEGRHTDPFYQQAKKRT